MRQKLFTGWAIALMMFVLYSCSNNINDYLDSDKIDSLKLDKDSVSTRSREEKEETPLEWIDNIQGTSSRSVVISYMYIGDEPESKFSDKYIYYVVFDWSAGFQEYPNDAENYMMKIQWRMNHGNKWEYINMPDNNYGLVKVLYSRNLEDIPAFAFPHVPVESYLMIRMRTIHKDFINSAPNPDGPYKYNSDLVSVWEETSMHYLNPWGFGKPQPQLIGDDWEINDIDEVGSLIVRVYLPYEIGPNKQYTYSYEVINTTGGYTDRYMGSTNFMGIGKSSVQVIGTRGGTVEIFATKKNNSTGECAYSNQWIDYSTGEREIVVDFNGADFHFSDPYQ